jgi:hypothetical protein
MLNLLLRVTCYSLPSLLCCSVSFCVLPPEAEGDEDNYSDPSSLPSRKATHKGKGKASPAPRPPMDGRRLKGVKVAEPSGLYGLNYRLIDDFTLSTNEAQVRPLFLSSCSSLSLLTSSFFSFLGDAELLPLLWFRSTRQRSSLRS